MFKASKILFTCFILSFSSLSAAESPNDNETNLKTNQTIERIDINHADIKTLSLLKGVGIKKAEAIIKYRDENGNFISIDDLLNVTGIGKKIIALNKTKLTI